MIEAVRCGCCGAPLNHGNMIGQYFKCEYCGNITLRSDDTSGRMAELAEAKYQLEVLRSKVNCAENMAALDQMISDILTPNEVCKWGWAMRH